MAEDQEALQPDLLLHGPEGQECPQGFAGPWTGKDQQIALQRDVALQATPQQLNQVLLPLARPDRGATAHPINVIGK